MMNNFADQVRQVVSQIPKGQTLAYGDVARLAGRPRAWRAVGNILNKNYDPNVPCHRVIRADGRPGGYNRGTMVKIRMLKKENPATLKGGVREVEER